MADLEIRLRNKEFRCWVRCVLVLDIARKTFINVVDNEMRRFHFKISQEIKKERVCYSCNNNTAASCPNTVCNTLMTQIEHHHRHGNPCYENADFTKWQHSYWEVAKCFIFSSGYICKRSAKQTDATGIISIITNFSPFGQLVNIDMNDDKNIFHQVRRDRNKVIHRPSLAVTEREMKDFCNLILTMLGAFKNLDTTKAVSEIEKVRDTTKSDPMDTFCTRERAAKALWIYELEQELTEHLQTCKDLLLKEANEQTEKFRHETNRVVKRIETLYTGPPGQTKMKFIQICKETLNHIVMDHIKNSRPVYANDRMWNLKAFLHFIEKAQGMEVMLPKHKEMLYQNGGEPVEVAQWDIALLVFILKVTCDRTANGKVIDYIETLRATRDRILDGKKIDRNHLKCLKKDMPEAIKHLVEGILEQESIPGAQNAVQRNVLENWQMTEFKIGQKAASKDYEVLRGVIASVKERLDQLVDQLKIANVSEQQPVEMACSTNIGLRAVNLPEKKYQELVEVICERPTHENVAAALNERIWPNYLDGVGVGCIVLAIKCPTPQSLITFWNDCISGKVLLAFDGIKELCRKRLECKTLDFEVFLTEAEVERCFNTIVHTSKIASEETTPEKTSQESDKTTDLDDMAAKAKGA